MTLTQAAGLTRKGIITIILLAILVPAGLIGYNIQQQRYLESLPPVEEKPEMKFGALSKPIFPPSPVSSSNYSYSLDTVTGGLPQAPKILKVYFIPQSSVTLLAPEKSRQLAENLGFLTGPEILSSTKYKFTNDTGGELIVDLTNNNFSFQSTASAILTNPTDKAKLVADFKNFLASKNILTEDLSSGRSNISPDGTISIWPADFDSLPIVTASFNQGLIKIASDYSALDYTFWVIDKTTFSTYLLKSAEQAFEDLKGGQGFISIEPKNPQVSISSVYLAYFQSKEYSPYLQPVFVFEGPEFASLVPAIKE